MKKEKIFGNLRRAYLCYDRFMEKQGFYVVLALCVLIIALSAIYTFHLRKTEPLPLVSATGESAAEAGGNQNAQSLAEAEERIISGDAPETVAPVNTLSPLRMIQPVDGFVDRRFSLEEPQFFAAVNAWLIHPGIDLQAEYGTKVSACAAGKVLTAGKDNQLGLCVVVEQDNGYQVLYAGLGSAGYVQPGDRVSQGQVIGHVGNGVLAESDGKPHLHLEIRKNGTLVDPLQVFLGIDN